jgi:hypothetical protein
MLVNGYCSAGLSISLANGYCNTNVITVDGLSVLDIFP